MTCHRKSKAIEIIMMSTATMTVIGERFIIQVCARNQSDVTPELCHSQTDPVPNFPWGVVVRLASSATTRYELAIDLNTAKAIGIDIALAPAFPCRRGDRMKPASSDRRPLHHSPIFWIGIALCLAAIAIYLWSDDLSWRPAPVPR